VHWDLPYPYDIVHLANTHHRGSLLIHKPITKRNANIIGNEGWDILDLVSDFTSLGTQ